MAKRGNLAAEQIGDGGCRQSVAPAQRLASLAGDLLGDGRSTGGAAKHQRGIRPTEPE
jgi:hypothetical protein